MPGSFAIFVALIVLLLVCMNVRVYRAARQFFPERSLLLKLVFAGSLGGMFLGRLALRAWPDAPFELVVIIGSAVQLAVIISAVLLLVMDVLALTEPLLARARAVLASRPAGAAPVPASVSAHPEPAVVVEARLPRRELLSRVAAGSALMIGGTSSLYGTLRGRHDYRIEEVPVRLEGLSGGMSGFSIVQLSDIHVGTFVGERELETAEQLVRQARPDLIVLTGDLLDNDARLAEQLGRFVRRLDGVAREGVVAVSGNHDFYAGIDAFESALTRAGARVLRNRGLIVQGSSGIALLGVDDVWARRRGGGPDLQRAIDSLPMLSPSNALDLPRVLLCHNPSYFAEAAGKVGLQLSGHTHGGQINLGIRPADFVLPGGWVAGLYREQSSDLYVNRGFGTVGPPARIGAPPEITRIVLHA